MRLQNYVIGKFYRFFMAQWESTRNLFAFDFLLESNTSNQGGIQLKEIAKFGFFSAKATEKWNAEIINYPKRRKTQAKCFKVALKALSIFAVTKKQKNS